MQITPSLLSLPGPLWPLVVAPDRVLSMGQIELFDIQAVYVCYTELFEIELFWSCNWGMFNRIFNDT